MMNTSDFELDHVLESVPQLLQDLRALVHVDFVQGGDAADDEQPGGDAAGDAEPDGPADAAEQPAGRLAFSSWSP